MYRSPKREGGYLSRGQLEEDVRSLTLRLASSAPVSQEKGGMPPHMGGRMTSWQRYLFILSSAGYRSRFSKIDLIRKGPVLFEWWRGHTCTGLWKGKWNSINRFCCCCCCWCCNFTRLSRFHFCLLAYEWLSIQESFPLTISYVIGLHSLWPFRIEKTNGCVPKHWC